MLLSPPPAPSRPARLRREGFAFLGVAALVLLCQWGIAGRVDIEIYDESYYLLNSQPAWPGRVPVFWSPSYQLYLFTLSRLSPGMIATYLANYQFTALLVPAGLYIGLRGMGVNRLVCVLGALYLGCWPALWFQYPRVSLFAGAVLMAGTGLALYLWRRNAVSGRLAFVWALTLAASARQELAPALYLALGLAAWHAWRIRRDGPELRRLLIGSALAVVVMVGWNLPRGHEDRNMVAFRQHFSGSYIAHHAADPTAPKTDSAVMATVFGPVTTVGQAIRANPQVMLAHSIFNLKQVTGMVLMTPLGLLFPQEVLGGRAFLLGAGALGLLALAAVALRRRQLTRRLRAVWAGLPTQAGVLLPLLAAIAAELAACVILSPRQHYFTLAFSLILLTAGLVLAPALRAPSAWLRAVAGGLLIFYLVVSPKAWQTVDSQPRPNVQLLTALNRAPALDMRFFLGLPNLANYLAARPHLTHVGLSAEGMPLQEPGLVFYSPTVSKVAIPPALRPRMRLAAACQGDSAWVVQPAR